MNLALAKSVIASFAIGLVSLLNFVHGAESNRVAIVVNKYLKEVIEDNLNIYLQDLKNEGYEPILKEWDLENDPAPRALKGYLKGLYLEDGGLQGAVFIGDLPIPIVKPEAGFDKSWLVAMTDGYIAEGYYMDLLGKDWTEDDKDYKLKAPAYKTQWDEMWEDSGYPGYQTDEEVDERIEQAIKNEELFPIIEIWTSRIITSTLTRFFLKPEGELVNAYLEKNHAYRTGQVVFQKQILLYSIHESFRSDTALNYWQFRDYRHVFSSIFKVKEPNPAPITIDEFFRPLRSESYEILFWSRHGWKTSIDLGIQTLTSTILAQTSVNVSTAFLFPGSCWIGHYMEPGYFAGSYVFNETFYALGMQTSTLPTESSMNTNFKLEKSMGESFMEEFPKGGMSEVSAKYILGDGTLKLQSKDLVANKENSPQNYLTEKSKKPDDIKTVNLLLKTAIKQNDYGTLNMLIKKGANLIIQDEEGNTLLHIASAAKAKDLIIGLLMQSGIDIGTKNKFGKTAWDIAKENGIEASIFDEVIRNGTIEQLKFMIGNGADVNAKDKYEGTPLKMAIGSNKLEMVKLLIENGADINVKDNRGTTPLHNAIWKDFEIFQFLIANGANVNAKDSMGATPLHRAANGDKIEIIKLLIKNGADVNSKNDNDETPWDVANKSFRKNEEVLELLKTPERSQVGY